MNCLMLRRKIFLAIALVLIGPYSFAQKESYHWDQVLFNPNHPIYKIESRLWKGDKNALLEIAPYIGSKKELTEYLSYNHPVSATESDVARRIIEVCCLFTEDEIVIDANTTSQNFLTFLNTNWEKIIFSEYAAAFLITPLEKRPVKTIFREITESKKIELNREKQKIFNSLNDKNIQSLISEKDPKVLLVISSELYKERCWLNSFGCSHCQDKYVKLLQALTNFEISVEGGYPDYRKMVWHIETEFYTMAALNLLCYFSENYSKFKWNEKSKTFENKEIRTLSIGKENELFQLLGNKNDKKALDAFIQLTTCDPQRVTELADEYEYACIDKSYAIPIFPYKFLKQLVLLTDYCSANEIDFVGPAQLRSTINKFDEKLSFSERRKLEDSLINNLTLEEITAFEYWTLINERSWRLTYSAGRILDVFYSKNWDKLLKDEKQLNCYLKKSALFNRLGIIGVCNKYLVKFINSPQDILVQLEKSQTSDDDIKSQIEKIISQNNSTTFQKEEERIIWDGNNDCGVVDLEKKILKLTKKTRKIEETERAISEICSQINYEQIPIALNLIENYSFQTKWLSKYSFMERDFGFFAIGDFNKIEERKDFLYLYSQFSEYELYAYYLDNAGIDYKTNNKLDFDKIYELLKYNVVVAFVGGGGRQDNEVYSLVKLLELTFNTTLGFPKKLCSSNNMYACYSDKRAKAWRNYLIENNLLKCQHNEPVSFSYE